MKTFEITRTTVVACCAECPYCRWQNMGMESGWFCVAENGPGKIKAITTEIPDACPQLSKTE